MTRVRNPKDLLAGLLFVAFGVADQQHTKLRIEYDDADGWHLQNGCANHRA